MKKRARIKIFINTIGLMENYAPEEITIKMICAYSGINRSTFYDYFQDKYDLLEQISTGEYGTIFVCKLKAQKIPNKLYIAKMLIKNQNPNLDITQYLHK